MTGLDDTLLHVFNGALTPVDIALSSRWVLAIVGLPILVVLLRAKKYARVLFIVLTVAMSDVLVARVLKPLADRERPCRALPDVVAPDGCGPGASFPSGHATTAFALAVSAAPEVPYGWAVLLPLAVLVAVSRVSLGVHYPSDVLVGAALGCLLGILSWRLRIPSRRPPTDRSKTS